MLSLLLDAGVRCLIIYVVNQGETPNFTKAIFVSFAISLGFFLCLKFLGEHLGIFSLSPMAAVAIFVLAVACDLTVKRAAIAGAILLVYKIVMSLVFLWLFK